jgi:hypothetical protein
MKNKFLLFFLFAFFSKISFSQKAFGYDIPKKIGYELLRGSWVAKESRDLKTFKSDNLSFNGLNAECYLQSTWTFETDSTGIILVPKSKLCAQPTTFKFKYSLLESQTGFGPSYKLDVVFDNGLREFLYLGSWDGKSKLKMGYKQKSIDVTIVYTFKKES